jgi:hypothetical protein
MRKPFYVRCYAKRSEGQWVAVCVDLCLAAQADSFAEAKQKLDAQIRDYVFEALTVDRAHARELLSRKAPIQNRLEYLAIRCLELILGAFHSKRPGRKQRAFEELVSVPA